jgi:YesN/AraC family two-component response regulator
MLKSIFARKKSVLFSWLFSYIIFLLLFVIVSLSIYVNTKKITETEVNKAHSLLLLQIGKSMDSIIKEAKRLSMEIRLNPRIQSITSYEGEISDPNRYKIYEVIKDLNMYKASNSSIDNIYIVQNKIGMVVSSDHSTDIKSFYRANYSTQNDAYLNWSNQFNSLASDNIFSDYITNGNLNIKVINFVHSLSLIDSKSLSTSVVVSIQEKVFLEQAQEVEQANSGSIYILDSHNNLVASSNSKKLSKEINLEKIADSKGILFSKIDGKEVVVSYISSKETDWKYVLVVPSEVFLKKIESVRNITYLCVFTSMLLAFALIYFFLKKNYSSVSNLLSLVTKELDIPIGNNKNEYVYIQDAINKTAKDKRAISKQLDSQKAILKMHFLEGLLKNTYNNETPVFEALHSFDLNFSENGFIVMLFYIEDTSEEWKEKTDLYFILSNVMEDLLSKHFHAITTTVDDTLTCLINTDANQEKLRDTLFTLIAKANNFMSKHFKVEFTVSLSSIHNCIEEISSCYREALDTMSYKKTLGVKENISYEDITPSLQGTYFYPIGKEQQLLNFIKSGDYVRSKNTMDELFEENLHKYKLSIELAQCLMLNMVSTMIRAVNEVSNTTDSNDIFLKELNPINSLLPCKTINEMRDKLDIFLNKLCQYIAEVNKNNTNWIANDVVPFINNNYTDINLSISSIADEFEVHPVYISKAFKAQFGEALLDYINKVRIDQSKLLLSEKKDENLEEIAKEVGYNNARTFTRYFKKYEGITPGKFKELSN